MKEDKVKIDVAEHLANILSSRDVIAKLASIITKADAKSVDLDFSKVDFISRSATHELLTLKNDLKRKFLKKKDINFINTNESIKQMFRVVAANTALPETKDVEFNVERLEIDSLVKNSQLC